MIRAMTVFALFFLLLTTGCSTNVNPANKGVDDFPNSVILIGKVVSDNLSSYSEWNQFEEIQDTLPDIFYAESLHTLYSDTNASQRIVTRGNSKDSVIWNLQDTAQGTAVVYYFKDAFFFLISDTLTVLYNDSAKDSIFGNETVLKKHGKTSARFSIEWLDYKFTDSDTNGFFDSMNISHSKTGILGTIITSARATSGNDNNFTNALKIKFSMLQSLMISSQDTLWLHEIEDTDFDGKVFDSSRDSNLVNYTGIIKNPILRPKISRIERRIRARIIPSNRRKIIVSKFFGLHDYKDGSQGSISIFGNHADSSFEAKDTAYIKLEKNQHESIHTNLTFTVVLGQNVYDGSGHSLLSFGTQKTTPADTILASDFKFEPDTAITVFSQQVNGSFVMNITYTGGSLASISGIYLNGVIDAVYTDPQGVQYSIKWNKNGEVIE